MPVSYKKLFALMKSKDIKKIDLRKEGINPKTVNSLVHNRSVTVDTMMVLIFLIGKLARLYS